LLTKFLNWLHHNYAEFQQTQPDNIPLSRVTENHLLEFKRHLLKLARPNQDFVFSENPNSFIRELRDRYKLYAFVAGWKYLGGPHLLRHTFISRLSEHHDCPPQLLMYLARHDRPENTVRYIHRSDTQLNHAINRIDFLGRNNHAKDH